MLMEEEVRSKQEEKEREKSNSTVFIYTMGAMALVIGYVFMQLNMLSQQNKNTSK
jgi:hypothetical protein